MSKIVSVHSFRHGTGQSNLTANLAVSIAQHGKRVGIIDIDTLPPGIHTLFGLDHDILDSRLNDYLWGTKSTSYPELGVPMEQGEIILIGGNVYLVPGEVQLQDMPDRVRQGYDTGRVNQGFLDLHKRLNLDYLLIDTYPGLTEDALIPIALSDVLLLVMSLDPPTFQGIAVIIDVARKLGVPDVFLVANQVLPELTTDEVRQQLEDTYGKMVAGILPFSEDMLNLASSGIFCLQYPDHWLTQSIQAIALQLLDERSPVQAIASTVSVPVLLQELPPVQSGSILNVLTLPDAPRRLLNWIMRRGTVTLADMIAYTNESETTLAPMLEPLLNQGFIQKIDLEGEPGYRPCLTSSTMH